MIFTDRTITVKKGTSSIDDTIVLYRGDKEVEIRFTLNESSPFRFGIGAEPNIIEKTEAAYGQLVIKTPNDLPSIFSEIVPTNEGKIVFTITAEMIDEITEVGNYTFQIRLLDESRNSRATLPEVVNGIEIREPIATEDVTDTNEVGVATVGYAMTTAGTTEDAFDTQGNYNKTTWGTGDRITAAKLNKIEAAIDGVNKKVASGGSGEVDLTGYAKTEDIPTRVSQLTNDANYVNTTQMNEAIANVTGQTVVEPAELDMPKVFFYGNALPTTKDNVNLTMDYISNTTKFSSFVKLKCQGTSSMSYAKKNFTINMYSDEARATKLKKDFKGWGAQSKFCLKANYVDTTHTRNISGARIAYDMVASRPDSAFKQQLLQCPRNGLVDGFPIKLYFNGEFYGIYTWNIPKDTWMFNMDKSNLNHIVLCAERNTDGNANAINSCQFRQLWTNGDGQDWSVEVGTMSEDLRTKFNRVIAFVMNATDQEFHDNIGEYFDLYSLLDYYCFSYFVNHLDGLAKNMLMVTYDGVIWGASLYDMDSIYGVSWNGANYVATNYQCPEQYQERFSALWPRIEKCFATELYARYLELRQGALSLSNIVKHVEEIYDVIPDRVFADEKTKWTSLPNVNNNTMTRFRNYMRDRAVYVDAQMQEIGTKVPCTGIVLSADTLSFTTTNTQTLSVVVSPTNCTDTVTWSVSPTNIVSVDNGVVTPVSNGSCTITATCGSYSDTCAVTVSLPVVECTGITLDKHELVFSSSSSEETIDITQNTTAGSLIRGSWAIGNNGGMSSFGNIKVSAADTSTDFIPFTSNNTLTISQPASTYGCGVVAYDSNKQALSCYTENNTWEAGDTQNGIDIKTLTVNVIAPPADTAYIRICFNLTDLSNVTVVKKYTNNGVGSQQLTATVAPSNCTQPVVWSVSPEGIVTVNNGLVTAVSNGEATVTATCGSYSDTCNVTVSGISESGGGTDTTLLYSLPEETVFNGTSTYIDTGVALLSTDQDFTMIMDVTANVSGNPSTCLIHCMNEAPPYPGINLQASGAGGFKMNKGSNTTQIGDDSKPIVPISQRTKLAIVKNGATIKVYTSNNFKGESPYQFTAHDKTLILGAYQSASGDKGRFFKGTVHEFSVNNTVYANEQINTYLGVNVATE